MVGALLRGGIVAAQIGNVFACRTERASVLGVGLLANRGVLAGIATELALFVTLISVPPLARAFALAPLSPADWAMRFAILRCATGVPSQS